MDIVYNAKAGVTQVMLPNGIKAVVVNGQFIAGDEFVNQLETAGFTQDTNLYANKKDVTGGGSAPSTALTKARTTSISRYSGLQNSVNASSANGAYYPVGKLQYPAPIKRIRLHIYNYSGALVTRNIKAVIAPTEKSSLGIGPSTSFGANVGGAVKTVLASDAEPYGYRRFLWNGNPIAPELDLSGWPITEVGHNGQTNAALNINTNSQPCITSDWLEVPSVACNDGGAGWFYVIRLAHPAGVDEGMVYAQMTRNNADYAAGMARMIAWSSAATDCVNDLTAGAVNNAGVANGVHMAVEVDYGVPALTVWGVGDSVSETFNWQQRAVYANDTASKPVGFVCLGGSSTRTESYLANLFLHLQQLTRPDIVILPSISINNYSPVSGFNMRAALFEIKRLGEVVSHLNSLGIKVILWTCYNYTGDTVTTNPIYVVNKYVRDLCASGQATLCEVSQDPRMNLTAYVAGSNETGFFQAGGGDMTHPGTEYGQPLLTSILTTALATVIGGIA